ncbi:MAG: HupE/UreJ family protein [Pseudohongiella sp.]|uniref:HupE/UreJ family protein n=1 Tax=Pseudohongiella sp. TaxID=1979412 RepID=UPI0034A008F9
MTDTHKQHICRTPRWLLLCGLAMVTLPGIGIAHDMTDTARERMASGGYLEVMWTGAEHMLSGYDHLLFLLGVMFFLSRFTDILKFVTAFTVGHTITLIAATYAGITANHYLIDAVIAVTVAYKGFENLDGFRRWLGINAPNLLLMVFIFGLIHGFGLSARLQEVTLADDPALLSKILLFNVGVEFGQIAALVVMAFAIRAWQHVKGWALVSKMTNIALIIAGAGLLVFQLYGYAQERGAAQDIRFDIFSDREQMMGQVSHADGSALANADLLIMPLNTDITEPSELSTDSQGWFVFSGRIDQTYRVQLADNSAAIDVTLGTVADEHLHELHIPFYVYIAILLLLSVIPANMLRRRERPMQS